LDVEITDLEGSVTGSGDIFLSGKTKNLDCKVTGSGDFKAYDLKAQNVKATVMGSGDLEISVSGNLYQINIKMSHIIMFLFHSYFNIKQNRSYGYAQVFYFI